VLNTAGPFLTEANLKSYFSGRTEVELKASGSIDLYVLSEAQMSLVRMKRHGRVKKRRAVEGRCRCGVLERVAPGQRLFFTANVVRVQKSYVTDEARSSRRGFLDGMLGVKREATGRREFLKRNFRMVVVTGVFGWRRVRPFIEYLENEEVDKSGMCADVDRTVAEIEKMDAMYF